MGCHEADRFADILFGWNPADIDCACLSGGDCGDTDALREACVAAGFELDGEWVSIPFAAVDEADADCGWAPGGRKDAGWEDACDVDIGGVSGNICGARWVWQRFTCAVECRDVNGAGGALCELHGIDAFMRGESVGNGCSTTALKLNLSGPIGCKPGKTGAEQACIRADHFDDRLANQCPVVGIRPVRIRSKFDSDVTSAELGEVNGCGLPLSGFLQALELVLTFDAAAEEDAIRGWSGILRDAIRDAGREAQQDSLTRGGFGELDLGCGKRRVTDDFWVQEEGI